MAPIRWLSHHGPWFAGTLLGGCLALALTAAPASAEISSVDAYGGQAQVLGKPVHHHPRAAGGSSGARDSGRESGQSTGASGSDAGGGGSAGSSSGSVSHSTSGSSSGAPATPNHPHGANPAGGGSTTGGGGGSGAGSHGGGATAGAAGTGGASGASGTGQSPPIAAANVAEVSNGSLSLSALDVLLLLAVFVGLAGVGVLIRRWSRQAE
jgi:hypothetical protein